MKLRFRILAALLALTGLLGFTAEGASAAGCAVQMEVSQGSADGAAANGPSCFAGIASSQSDGSVPAHGTDSGAPHCPVTMGAPGACGAIAALAAVSLLEVGVSHQESRPALRPEDVRELLLAAHFFRPPIA